MKEMDMILYIYICIIRYIAPETLRLENYFPGPFDFLLGTPPDRCYVSFRQGIH